MAPLVALGRALRTDEVSRVRAYVRGLLVWNATLLSWPRPAAIPDATPFVSLYVDGRLRGCFGAHEGPPGERLARAFLMASADARFGSARREERGRAAAQVAFVRAVRRIDGEAVERELELARDGIALVDRESRSTILLPGVAREGRMDLAGFVAAIASKARLPREDWGRAGVFLFRTEEVTVRRGGPRSSAPRTPADAAAAHLAGLVSFSGEMAFAVDPRSGARAASGPMHHGRVAVALRALAEHGEHPRVTGRARRRLAQDVADGLRARDVAKWPERPELVAGTLALVSLAGVDVREELAAWARAHRQAIAAHPWHAAQVVVALGRQAPDVLWSACERDLDARPWAPWTALAARARGDERVHARAVEAVAASIRAAGPHAGGCAVRPVPETALTALAVEALAPVPGAAAPVRRARAFLRGMQIPDEPHASFVRRESAGGFMASPVADVLRADITGHAMLALARPP